MGKIYFIILSLIRSSKFFTQFIWGIKIDTKLHNTFWDLTTLVLKKEIINMKNKKNYLDMGCGQFAILGQYFKKNNPPYVPSSKKKDKLEFPNIRYSDLDGIKTTKDFLNEAKNFLIPEGEILLGINTFYVTEKICAQVIIDTGYNIKKITKMRFNTSIVFKINFI